MSALGQYLSDLKQELSLEPTSEAEIAEELQTHIEEEAEELCGAGFAPEAADKLAAEHLGSAKVLAREIYHIHSQGTRAQAFLAALPHLLIALTLALHMWQEWQWVMLLLITMAGLTIYQWRHSKPAWLYPWLGYCLLLLLLAPLFLYGGLPNPYFWLLLLVYLPFALWLLGFFVIRAIHYDWLLASTMLLPFPVATGWLITLKNKGLLYSGQEWQNSSTPIALIFLGLGIAVAISMRLKQRWLKVGLLLTAMLAILIAILVVNGPAFLALAFFLTSLFFIPKLLERKVRHRWWVSREQHA